MSTERKAFIARRREHWDNTALQAGTDRKWARYYHTRLDEIFEHLVPAGLRVLEIGSSYGDLLAALRPSFGVGVDFSGEMLAIARSRHPHLHFVQADAHRLPVTGPFDAIILSDLVNDLWDVQEVFRELSRITHPGTRVVINTYSRLWETPLSMTARLDLARPRLHQNWLTVEDVSNLLGLSGFHVLRHWSEIMFPLGIPLVAGFLNRFLVRFWPFRHLALTNFIIARPVVCPDPGRPQPTVSVIIPTRNEAGNVDEIFRQVPEMGGGTELVFVEGHSRDNTYEEIERAVIEHPGRRTKLLKQRGEGKGDAVREGFAHADGDILMILDADMTVRPEDLPRFYEALASGNGEFINGVRLVYPMEDRAMRFFNLVGNKGFGMVFSWLIGRSVKDTLCGTKVLWKSHYESIAANRGYFGRLDPFGDFDLILGAAKLNLHIVDLPVRYRERQYGETNIRRWQHGWLLLRMALIAALRIKFV
jgi:SAM-dependent methyltransferase